MVSRGVVFAACLAVAGCARDGGASVWVGVASAQGRPAQSASDASARDVPAPQIRQTMDAGVAEPDGSLGQPPGVAMSDHPLRNFLGRRMAEIQEDAGPPLDGGSAWRPFRGGVFVQFLGDRVARITARVPAGTGCDEAARRFGFDRAMPPLRRARTCEWPARSERHAIEPGVGARLDLGTGTFEVWVE